jgi:hypothetical protein
LEHWTCIPVREVGGMNVLDRLIGWLSPTWGARRKQTREALTANPEAQRSRNSDNDGWQRFDDVDNPLNPSYRALQPRDRRWFS